MEEVGPKLAFLAAALAVAALGISAGAMLTEGAVLVPYWRALPPSEFLRWFAANEPRLVAFYGPLELVSAVLPLLAAGLGIARRRPGAWLMAGASLLAVAVLLLYPLYFRSVNARFATGAMDPAEVTAELSRWSAWQWVRIAAGAAAFGTALAALVRGRGWRRTRPSSAG